MPIFRIQGEKAHRLSAGAFPYERELQTLIERNSEEIFGVRFVATKVATDGGEIDTLGLDESNAPVVVEYKRGEQDEAIIQALSYLDWIVNNRWEVSEIVRTKLGGDVRINWGEPKVIVVAQSFSRRVKDALGRLGENIELWTYTKHGDDLVSFERFGASSPRAKSRQRVTKVRYEETTLADHLKKANKNIAALFDELQRAILQLGDAVEEKPKKFYVGYWHNRIFCKVRFQRTRLKVSIYTKGVRLDDPKRLANPSPKAEEGSKEYHFFWLTKPEDVSYAVSLIKQSYRSTL